MGLGGGGGGGGGGKEATRNRILGRSGVDTARGHSSTAAVLWRTRGRIENDGGQ